MVHDQEENYILLPWEKRIFKLQVKLSSPSNIDLKRYCQNFITTTNDDENTHQLHLLDEEFLLDFNFENQNHGACILFRNLGSRLTHNVKNVNIFIRIMQMQNTVVQYEGLTCEIKDLLDTSEDFFHP